MEDREDVPDRARYVLTPQVASAVPRVFIDDCCANCLNPLTPDTDGLFCSRWCRETAKNARYFRRAFRDGRIDDPDVREALRTRIAFMLGGGYSALGRTLRSNTRAAVIERDRGKCRLCGKPGTEIDHIEGSSPELTNLQLLCHECHAAKTDAALRPASEQEKALIEAFMRGRVEPEEPVLLADDEESWDRAWRGLLAARRARVR
ncbi:MAG: HNH endonuclease [Sorangiineae bacterium]|nr:HNH endonuclease [Polyangiaceae bacterium]MEB2323364.1 HNH endonuclease [Sorangiineae bacterium]